MAILLLNDVALGEAIKQSGFAWLDQRRFRDLFSHGIGQADAAPLAVIKPKVALAVAVGRLHTAPARHSLDGGLHRHAAHAATRSIHACTSDKRQAANRTWPNG